MWQVSEAIRTQGGSSQVTELKAIQLALDIAVWEKWPTLYLYTDSWMVANAIWVWLDWWKKANWQKRNSHLGCSIVAKLPCLDREVDCESTSCRCTCTVPKSWVPEEHCSNRQLDQAAKIKVFQVDLDWQHRGESFLAQWAHDTSGHQGRDAIYRWARDQGMDLTMNAISQSMHNCEICGAIKHVCETPLIWGTMVEIRIWGGLPDWLHHTPANLPKHADNGGDNYGMAGDIPCASYHCL